MGKRRELVVNTHQMLILLQFNSAGRLSCAEIKEATGMSDSDAIRNLQVRARASVTPLSLTHTHTRARARAQTHHTPPNRSTRALIPNEPAFVCARACVSV